MTHRDIRTPGSPCTLSRNSGGTKSEVEHFRKQQSWNQAPDPQDCLNVDIIGREYYPFSFGTECYLLFDRDFPLYPDRRAHLIICDFYPSIHRTTTNILTSLVNFNQQSTIAIVDTDKFRAFHSSQLTGI